MNVNVNEETVAELLDRGVEEAIVREHLEKCLKEGRVLRVKFGIDPTSPNMHLGHTVPLRKLRQFQDAGHQAVLIIGDATAMIGDPTGRTEARQKLSRADIDVNKQTYLEQAGKILDLEKLEVHHNGEWFDSMSAAGFLELTSLVTVQQVLQREDFQKRVDDPDHPLSALELAYPVMQGYDSVMVTSDVELGGADQKLNLLMGRRMQRKFDQEEQDVMTVPLLVGTDGERKMSKSFGNAILLADSPEDKFAKTMSIPDGLIVNWFTLLTDLPMSEVSAISKSLIRDEVNPRDVKARLGFEIVKGFHGYAAAQAAQDAFNALFRDKKGPDAEQVIEVRVDAAPARLLEVLVAAGFVQSKGDARRQIEQGGVKVDGEVVRDLNATVPPGAIIQKGPRHFARVTK
ncbi:tyrosine--tRNA ligase [Candidatus Uhrbacteria bacterium RIFOXYB12_FULL_58_10]|uniref:Tyrosine--tRNA ligase n=1 Tax=Candidatus Uhrbacteria bacterium RIFOXYB2_FULL_57_15 TaxID=1802422 RepID=A0A1F7W794_9BACT|nr:MAG: tyrosine--tRNA ligase [Candidatus Uhrbacteria bacterium RIFOXYB12_FULL_58_10]OGL98649.1 MAG: tyrosine--tRNA ligase [Candidatus Uhrbacteria bacterium RIFOXYB2_FULL_57_15]OGL99997.1 MAG: tyrosine--tRNA ligase [Candidatus Uhrbacteria bacterium RIFOXYC12_FULL_57_11]